MVRMSTRANVTAEASEATGVPEVGTVHSIDNEGALAGEVEPMDETVDTQSGGGSTKRKKKPKATLSFSTAALQFESMTSRERKSVALNYNIPHGTRHYLISTTHSDAILVTPWRLSLTGTGTLNLEVQSTTERSLREPYHAVSR